MCIKTYHKNYLVVLSSPGPQFFDCVWLIKRFSADNVADAVLLRLREVLVGDGE